MAEEPRGVAASSLTCGHLIWLGGLFVVQVLELYNSYMSKDIGGTKVREDLLTGRRPLLLPCDSLVICRGHHQVLHLLANVCAPADVCDAKVGQAGRFAAWASMVDSAGGSMGRHASATALAGAGRHRALRHGGSCLLPCMTLKWAWRDGCRSSRS